MKLPASFRDVIAEWVAGTFGDDRPYVAADRLICALLDNEETGLGFGVPDAFALAWEGHLVGECVTYDFDPDDSTVTLMIVMRNRPHPRKYFRVPLDDIVTRLRSYAGQYGYDAAIARAGSELITYPMFLTSA